MSTIPAHLLSNPLVNPPALPHGAPPFDVIADGHFMPAFDWALDKVRAEIAAIRDNPAAPSFDNTIVALDRAGRDLARINGIFNIYTDSCSNDNIRAISERVGVKLSAFYTDMVQDEVMFARVEALYNVRDTLGLDAEEMTVLEKSYRSQLRNGVNLDAQNKQRVREIDERLTTLEINFSNNMVKSEEAYLKVVSDAALLDGVPDRIKDILADTAAEKGYPNEWAIRTSDAVDVMEYAHDRALRQEMYMAYGRIAQDAPYDNSPIVLEMVALRHERAQIFGYPNHAAYTLADRMAGDVPTVMAFLQKNLTAYKAKAITEIDDIRRFATAQDGIATLEPWDVGYYARRLKEQTLAFEEESLRPYFKLENVRDGLFRHAEKLFDIEIRGTAGKYPVYHPDVTVYEVHDRRDGSVIGLFYADFYERQGTKESGAWMSQPQSHMDLGHAIQKPIVFNNCNYTKPAEGKPTLLSIRDVETMFHEFGHGLHGLLSKCRFEAVSGTNVMRDWVELPSQVMENWCGQKDVLDDFAVHHETGQKIPADLMQKMMAARNFAAGRSGLRQTYFGLLDMAWYTTDPATIASVDSFEEAIDRQVNVIPAKGWRMSPQFGHLFPGGYGAGYYSYKWAEVLDADVFSTFQKNGLYDKVAADRLRDTIYATGGARHPRDLFVAMIGRAPDPDAMFRREGLLPAASSGGAAGTVPAPKP